MCGYVYIYIYIIYIYILYIYICLLLGGMDGIIAYATVVLMGYLKICV